TPDSPDLGDSGTILAQFQDSKGSGEITLEFAMFKEGLLVTQDNPLTQQTDSMAPPKPMIIKEVVPNARLRGRWFDAKVRAVWSMGSQGAIDVWLNGRRIHSHRGRNLNRNVAPSFKFGIYRTKLHKYREKVSSVVPTQTVIFDGVARGSSEAEVSF
ncbi:MAG: heparin lyase I family protein, partial [Pseudomonadota bacterium]